MGALRQRKTPPERGVRIVSELYDMFCAEEDAG